MADEALQFIIGGDTRPLERQIASVASRLPAINLRVNVDPAPLGRITGDLRQFDRSLEASNARVIAFGATTSVIFGVEEAFRRLITTTINVNKEITQLNSLLNGPTQQFARLRDSISQIAGETGQSFNEVTKAASEFARQGLNTAEALQRTRDAMILTRTTGIQVGQAVQDVTNILDVFSNEALKSTDVINKLVGVGNNFAIGGAALTESVTRSAAAAKEAGLSFEQLISVITALQQSTGRGAGIISQGLRQIFQRLERSTTIDSLNEMGIAVKDTQGNVLPLIQVLQNLSNSYSKLGSAQQTQVIQLVAGLRQGDIAKALFNDLSSSTSKYAQALQFANNAQDAAIRRNEEFNQSLSAIINKAKETGTAIASAIGGRTIEPGLRELFTNINGIFDSISQSGKQGGFGANIGKGILDGIGAALQGPGAVLLTAAFIGIFAKVGTYASEAIGKLAGLDRAQKQQFNTQQQINVLLGTQNSEYKNTFNSLTTIEQKQKAILDLVQAQNSAYRTTVQEQALLAKAVIESGTPILGVGKRAAEGYLPVDAEQQDIQKGVGGASPAAKPVVVPNFNFGSGRQGNIVANTSEYFVKNFAGGSGTAVFNPQMIQAAGGLGKLNDYGKVERVAAGGLIPAEQSDFIKLLFEKRHNFAKFQSSISPLGGLRTAEQETLNAKVLEELLGNEYSAFVPNFNIFEQSRAGKFVPQKDALINKLKALGLDDDSIRYYQKLNLAGGLNSTLAEQLKIRQKSNILQKDLVPYGGGFIPNYALQGVRYKLIDEAPKDFPEIGETKLEYIVSKNAQAGAYNDYFKRPELAYRSTSFLNGRPMGHDTFETFEQADAVTQAKVKSFQEKFKKAKLSIERIGGDTKTYAGTTPLQYSSEAARGFIPNFVDYLDPFTIRVGEPKNFLGGTSFLRKASIDASDIMHSREGSRGEWPDTPWQLLEPTGTRESLNLEDLLKIIKKDYSKEDYNKLFPKVERLKGFGNLKQSEFGFVQPSYNPTVPRSIIDKLEGRKSNYAKSLKGAILGGGDFLSNVTEQIKTETGIDVSKEEALKMVNFRLAQPNKSYAHWFAYTGKDLGVSSKWDIPWEERPKREWNPETSRYEYNQGSERYQMVNKMLNIRNRGRRSDYDINQGRQGITIAEGRKSRGWHSFPYFYGFEKATKTAIENAARFAAVESPEKSIFDIAPRVLNIRDKYYKLFQERDLKGRGRYGTDMARSIRWGQHSNVRESFFERYFREKLFDIKNKEGENISIPSGLLNLLGVAGSSDRYSSGADPLPSVERTVTQQRVTNKIIERIKKGDYPANPEIKRALLRFGTIDPTAFVSLAEFSDLKSGKQTTSRLLRSKDFLNKALYQIGTGAGKISSSIIDIFGLPKHYNALSASSYQQGALGDIIFRGKQIKDFFNEEQRDRAGARFLQPRTLSITNKEADEILRYAFEKNHNIHSDGAANIAKEYFLKDTPFFEKRHQIISDRNVIDFLIRNKDSAQFTKERVAYGAAGQQRNFTYLDLVEHVRSEDLNQGAKSSVTRVFENTARRTAETHLAEIAARNAPFPEIAHFSKNTDKVKRLMNESQLIEEGNAMGHCVGGYGDACRFAGNVNAYGQATSENVPLKPGQFPRSVILSTGSATAELNPTPIKAGEATFKSWKTRSALEALKDIRESIAYRKQNPGGLSNLLQITAHAQSAEEMDAAIQAPINELLGKRRGILRDYLNFRKLRGGAGVINSYQIRGRNNSTPSESDMEALREYVRVNGMVPGFAKGFVPNFWDWMHPENYASGKNPLDDAINRESSAVGRDQVYIDQDRRLQNPQNPLGLLVANKRDEPFGGKQGVNRAIQEGRNPLNYGASTGLIPNFALPPKSFIDDLLKSYNDLTPQQQSARKRYAESVARENGIKIGRSGIETLINIQLELKDKEGAFQGLSGPPDFDPNFGISPFQALSGNVPNLEKQRQIQEIFKEEERRSSIGGILQAPIGKTSIFGGLFSSKGAPLFTRQRGRLLGSLEGLGDLTEGEVDKVGVEQRSLDQLTRDRRQSRLFTASFAAPVIGGALLGAFGGQESKGGRIAEGLVSAASTGAIAATLAPGPVGVGIGAAVGGFLALKTVLDNTKKSLEDFNKEAQKRVDKGRTELAAIDNAVKALSELKETAEASPLAQHRALQQAQVGIAGLPARLQEPFRQALNSGNLEEVNNINFRARLNQNQTEVAQGVALQFRKLTSQDQGGFSEAFAGFGGQTAARQGRLSYRLPGLLGSLIDNPSDVLNHPLQSLFRSPITVAPKQLNQKEIENRAELLGQIPLPNLLETNIPTQLNTLQNPFKTVKDILSANDVPLKDINTVLSSLRSTAKRSPEALKEILSSYIAYLRENKKIAEADQERSKQFKQQAEFSRLAGDILKDVSANLSVANLAQTGARNLGLQRAQGLTQIVAPGLTPERTAQFQFGNERQQLESNQITTLQDILTKSIGSIELPERLIQNNQPLIASVVKSITERPEGALEQIQRLGKGVRELGEPADITAGRKIEERAGDIAREFRESNQKFVNEKNSLDEKFLLEYQKINADHARNFLGGDFTKLINFNFSTLTRGANAIGRQDFDNNRFLPLSSIGRRGANILEAGKELDRLDLLTPETRERFVRESLPGAIAQQNDFINKAERRFRFQPEIVQSLEDQRGRIPQSAEFQIREQLRAFGPGQDIGSLLSRRITEQQGYNQAAIQSGFSTLQPLQQNTLALVKDTDAIEGLVKALLDNTAATKSATGGEEKVTGISIPEAEKNKARGFVPNFNAYSDELKDIKRGIGGARLGDRPLYANINGLGSAIVNSGEDVIRNFLGTGKDAVFNRNMKQAFGMPLDLLGNVSRGFVPNFGDEGQVGEIKKNRELMGQLLDDPTGMAQPSPSPSPTPQEKKSWFARLFGLSGGYMPNFGDLETAGAELPLNLLRKLFNKNSNIIRPVHALTTHDRILAPLDLIKKQNIDNFGKQGYLSFAKGYVPNFSDETDRIANMLDEIKQGKTSSVTVSNFAPNTNYLNNLQSNQNKFKSGHYVDLSEGGTAFVSYKTEQKLITNHDKALLSEYSGNILPNSTLAHITRTESPRQANQIFTSMVGEQWIPGVGWWDGQRTRHSRNLGGEEWIGGSGRRNGWWNAQTGRLKLARHLGHEWIGGSGRRNGWWNAQTGRYGGGYASGLIPNFANWWTTYGSDFDPRFPAQPLGSYGVPSRYGELAQDFAQEAANAQQFIDILGGNNNYETNAIFGKILGTDTGAFDEAFEREREYLQYRVGLPPHYAQGLIFAGYRPETGLAVGNYLDEPLGKISPSLGILQGINRVMKAGGNPRTAGSVASGHIPNFAANEDLINALKTLTTAISQQNEKKNQDKTNEQGGDNGVNVDHQLNVNASVNVAGKVDTTNENVESIINAALANLKSEIENKLNQIQNDGRYTPTPPQIQPIQS